MIHALKEWAVICQALADCRQAILLRKGGIQDANGLFQLEHDRFGLYPTYVHQQRTGIVPDAYPLLEQVERDRPSVGKVRLTHIGEVSGVYQVCDLEKALRLEGLHLWSKETVQARFAYRSPGLFVIPIRAYRVANPIELEETATYAGCKSWVELERDLPTEGATSVLSDEQFRDLLCKLENLLEPRAWV